MSHDVAVYVISDATGSTAESVATAMLMQFGAQRYVVKRFPFTRDPARLEAILEQASRQRCLVIYTLVSPELRAVMAERERRSALNTVDVMGPALGSFSRILERAPTWVPGPATDTGEDRLGLAEAVHFARRHDDGQGGETLGEADLVILGLSRTGKTPTSFYLACKKLKVANVPIVRDVPLPDAVRAVPRKVGFRMSLLRLVRLRRERARRYEAGALSAYVEEDDVRREIAYCERVYRELDDLLTLDVTNRSIEETAEWITRNAM